MGQGSEPVPWEYGHQIVKGILGLTIGLRLLTGWNALRETDRLGRNAVEATTAAAVVGGQRRRGKTRGAGIGARTNRNTDRAWRGGTDG